MNDDQMSAEANDEATPETIYFELKSHGPPRPAAHDTAAHAALGWIHMPILALLATAVVIRAIVGWPGGFTR